MASCSSSALRSRSLSPAFRQVHGQAMWTFLSGVAHLPAQPFTEYRRDGPVRCSNQLASTGLIRDRDRVYGAAVTHRLRAMGIRDKPIAPCSPWQNGFAERLIGSIRRECVDHVVALGEGHLRRVLQCYARYYNQLRTHRSLNKDTPVHRAETIISRPVLGGLHRQYCRI